MAMMATISRRLFCWSIPIRSLGAPGIGWVDVDVTAVGLTVRTRFATRLNPPPVPVTVSVYEPVGVFEGRVTVRVDLKLGVAEGVLKTPLAPDGNPDTVNETCELKPLSPTILSEYEAVCP